MQSSPDEAHQTKFGLTPRELDIVSAVVDGYSNKEISEYFKISEDVGCLDTFGIGTFAVNGRLRGPKDEDADATGIAARKPKRPNLNRGSATASLDELSE